MSVAKIINSPHAFGFNKFQLSTVNHMPAYATAKCEESQANSSSHIKTRGLHRHDSAVSTGLKYSGTLGHCREDNPVPGAATLWARILKSPKRTSRHDATVQTWVPGFIGSSYGHLGASNSMSLAFIPSWPGFICHVRVKLACLQLATPPCGRPKS